MKNLELSRARQAKYRASHRAEIAARVKALRVADPDKVRAQEAARRARNPGVARASQAKWNAAHPLKRRAMNNRWKAANPAKRRGYNQQWRAAKRNLPWEDFADLDVFKRDAWTCGICGTPVDPDLKRPDKMSVSLDHIVPLSGGGFHVWENVQCAHLVCNMRKGAKV